jgi:hypothetical protein
MALHVDIVKNEWLAGYQNVVARLYLDDDGKLHVDAADETWEETVLRPVGGLDPKRDPEEFLRHLADYIHGSYLFATEVHDADRCEFSNMVIPLRAAPPQRLPQASGIG